jgi:multicomponent Na+:H+ antiporter subunit E
MRQYFKQGKDGGYRPRRLAAVQPAAVVGLTVVWVTLWRDISVANLVGGAAVAVLVLVVFPLPPLRLGLRVSPTWLLWLVVHFLGSVVVASVQVVRLTLDFRRQPRNAVIEVNLTSESDFVLTVVAEMTSLVPGSVVVEARRFNHSLFLHVLDARDLAGVERMRRQVLALERRTVRAIGGGSAPLLPSPTPGDD